MRRFPGQRYFSGEDCAPQCGAHSPHKRRRDDEEISAQRVLPWRFSRLGFRRGGCGLAHQSSYTISKVILALFSSMAETEQYFSLESRTASSTAFCETLPPTRSINLIAVYTCG